MDIEKILKEKCDNVLRAPLKNFEGFMMASTFSQFCDRIKNMEVRNDDVWVSGFPKSGTTWSQEMIWLIGNDLDYKGAEVNQTERFSFIEISSVLNFKALKEQRPDFECVDFLLDPITHVDNLPSPRYIKTHLPWCLLPLQIQTGAKKPKIIHVIRNPKDVVVSFFNHAQLLHGYTGNFDEFFHLFMNDMVDYAPYFQNVLSYWNRRHLDNLLFLKYEDLLKDLRAAINTVAKFLGKTVPENEVPKLLKHLSFEEMKKNPAVNVETLVKFLRETKAFNVPDKKFIRCGKSGNYKENMSKEKIAIMDEWIAKNLKGTGLNLE
nr:sulfotransferase family cytosolic 1B member 1-like [Onthophagus taurus]